jgi:glycogen debranching enzyme
LNDGVAQPKANRNEPTGQIPEHYVEAQTSLVDRALRTLKHGDAFAVTDAHGDIGLVPESPEGLFFQDTRYLSFFELRLEGRRPLLLASVLQDDNAALSVDLTNPDIALDAESGLPRDMIALHRTKFLWSDACYERIGFRNYDSRSRRFQLQLRFDADFHDLFEVRGMKRNA